MCMNVCVHGNVKDVLCGKLSRGNKWCEGLCPNAEILDTFCNQWVGPGLNVKTSGLRSASAHCLSCVLGRGPALWASVSSSVKWARETEHSVCHCVLFSPPVFLSLISSPTCKPTQHVWLLLFYLSQSIISRWLSLAAVLLWDNFPKDRTMISLVIGINTLGWIVPSYSHLWMWPYLRIRYFQM